MRFYNLESRQGVNEKILITNSTLLKRRSMTGRSTSLTTGNLRLEDTEKD